MKPITRQEQLLNSIATGDSVKLEPITREEQYLAYLAGITDTKPEKPITRKEMFYDSISKGGGGGGETTEPGKPYIDTSKMTSCADFFRYNPSLISELDNLDTSNCTSFNGMFRDCTSLVSVPPLNTSKGTDFNNMFYGCNHLQTVSQLDTSKGTKFINTFRGCWKLTTIPPLDISKGTSFTAAFYGCRELETLSLTTAKTDFSMDTFNDCGFLENITIGEGWAVNIYLHYSISLTVESLHGMIENLADLTGQTAKTFQIGATNLAKIDEAHINMLQAKNWNYS